MRTRSTFRPVLVGLLSALPSPLAAQTVGVDLLYTETGYADVLESPFGVAVQAELPVGGPIHVRLALARSSEHQVVVRSTCTGLVPPDAECPDDVMDGRSRIDQGFVGIGVGAGASLPVRLQASVALVLTRLSSDFVGRSTGVNVGPIHPDGLTPGWSADAEARVPIRGRWSAAGGLRWTDTRIRDCGADAWFAFCDGGTWWSVSAGVRYAIRR